MQALREDGAVVAIAPRDAALLAWLALEGPTPRARLAELLWPGHDATLARNTLRQRLYQLRMSLGSLAEGGAVLRLADDVEHDLDGAAELLGTLRLTDAPELDAWIAAQRRHRAEAQRGALEREAQTLEDARDFDAALPITRQLLDLDPLAEAAHRRLMRLHYLRGDRAAALQAFDECERLLKDEVGTRPDAATLALLRTIESTCVAVPRNTPAVSLPVAVLRPPLLVGRDEALATLDATWQRGGVCAVVGEAGLGKSRLLEAFAERHPRAARAAGRPGDAAVPFATLARLLHAVIDTGGAIALSDQARVELARLLPEIGTTPLQRGNSRRPLLQSALVELLEAAAKLDAVIVDDLQFADAASLALLGPLIGSADPAPGFAWALALRPAEAGSALGETLEAIAELPSFASVVLAPLDAAQIARLVDSLALPGVLGAELAPALLKRSGGNPLYLLETLKLAWTEDAIDKLATGRLAPQPRNVVALIERRLARLSPKAQTLARVAAIAAPDFSIELAEAVLRQPAIELASAWSELQAAQVLQGSGFAHDLVQEAAQASVPEPIARRTHADVAGWLQAHSGEPARVAAHWIAAGHDDRAVAPLREAAARSAQRSCLAETRALLERAAAIAGDRHLDEEFDVLFDLHLNYAPDDPGCAHDRLVARLGEVAHGEVQRLRAAWARHNLLRYRQTTSPIAQLEADVQRARALGDERLLVGLVTMLVSGHLAEDRPEQAQAILAEHRAAFERSPQRSELGDLHGHLADVLSERDRFAESLLHDARTEALYREAGEPAEVFTVLCNRTRVLRQQGRIHAAAELFERIDRWHAAAAPNPRAWIAARIGACETLRDLGRYDEALRVLEQPDDELRLHLGRLYPAVALAQARLWLELGQLHRAQQTVNALGRSLDTLPDWLRARCGLAVAQVGARLRGDGSADRPGRDDWRALDAASAIAPRERRRSAWLECELQRAAWLEPAAGAALAESLCAVADAHELYGHAIAARLGAAQRHLDVGQPQRAAVLIAAARANATRCFDAEPEPVSSVGGSAHADWVIAQVLRRTEPDAAARHIEAAQGRLRERIAAHVPEPFRSAFVQRHPVHRALFALRP